MTLEAINQTEAKSRDEPAITRLLIHQIGDREVYGDLRIGAMQVESHEDPPSSPGYKPRKHSAYWNLTLWSAGSRSQGLSGLIR